LIRFQKFIEYESQRDFKAVEVSSAFNRIDIVDVSINRFVIAVVVLEREFGHNAVVFAFDKRRFRRNDVFPFVEIGYEVADAAVKFKDDLFRCFEPLVAEYDRNAAVQKREFAQALCKHVEIVCRRFGKNRFVGFPAYLRAVSVDRPDFLHFRLGYTDFVPLKPAFTVGIDRRFHP